MAGFSTRMFRRSRSSKPSRVKLQQCQQYLRCCSSMPSMVKVLTVDGQCLKLEAPISVKEVLMEHPEHAIFSSAAVRELGNKARPLHVSVTLQAGHLYFLIPSPQRRVSQTSNLSETPSLHEQCSLLEHSTDAEARKMARLSDSSADKPVASRSSETLQQQQILASICSNQQAASASLWKPQSLQVLPSPSDGVLRVKLLVSKRELASLLKESSTESIPVVEGPFFPLLNFTDEDESCSSRNIARSRNPSNSWRPALESIPESIESL